MKPQFKPPVKDQLGIISSMLYGLQKYNEDVNCIEDAIFYSNLDDKIRQKIREISHE